MKVRLLQLVFLTGALVAVSSSGSVVQAQAPNCTCQGVYRGYLPLPLADPVCVEQPYYANFWALDATSCQNACAFGAHQLAAGTCGTQCEREGQTYQVISYSWQGGWFFSFGPNGSHGESLTAC